MLAGCGDPSGPAELPKADQETCAALVAALPATVGGAAVHTTTYGATWGSWSLTCGVGRPKGLQATSDCLSVAGVDWFAPPGWYDDQGADVDLTTISLRPRTRLHVPGKDRGGAAAAALSDLAPTLKSTLRPAKHCQ